MSLQFNDTTTKKGIIQTIERNIKAGDGGISSNTSKLKDFTADVNLALDDALSIIFKAGGKWQFDDSNHEDYPFITTDIASGTRDYAFTEDEQGNLILDIYKVMRKNGDGIYEEIFPVDQQSEDYPSFYDGMDVTGIPMKYDKTANGIIFDVIPNYNSSDGLKIFISREGSYFAYTDTDKKPGFAGLYHKYLALKPSYDYAWRNGLKNTNLIKNELLECEAAMKHHYARREKDDAEPVISAEPINSV